MKALGVQTVRIFNVILQSKIETGSRAQPNPVLVHPEVYRDELINVETRLSVKLPKRTYKS